MFEFVLDLALDWDNVDDYTQYVVDEPQVIEQHQAIVEMPVEVVMAEPVDDTVSVESWKDRVRFPVFRGGVTVREGEERVERIPTTIELAKDTGSWIVDNWWIAEKTAESYDPRQHY